MRVAHLVGAPEVVEVHIRLVRVVPGTDGVDVAEVDVVEVVVEVPVADEEGAAPLAQHVAGDLGEPHPLGLALLEGGVEVGHARRVGQHGGVLLVGAEALHQLPGQLVGHGEAVGEGHLGAVELEPAAVRGQLHQLETDRGPLPAAVDGELLHRPLAPLADSAPPRFRLFPSRPRQISTRS